jgi:GAF domain-containing protein
MTNREHRTDGDGGGLLRKVDEVTSALEDLADVLSCEEDLPTLLQRVCQQALHAVPEAHMASVSLLRDGGPETVAATAEHAVEIDRAQYSAGEGPCLEAARTGRIVRVTVRETRDVFPDFVAAAGQAAVASYPSAPLFIDREYQGSLNMYGEEPHGFGELDAALLELYTTAAEAALRTARRYLQAREQAEQLRRALTTRAVIDQAKGVIMAARRVTADEAFTLLVEQSQKQNIKVRDLAQQFIDDILNDAD